MGRHYQKVVGLNRTKRLNKGEFDLSPPPCCDGISTLPLVMVYQSSSIWLELLHHCLSWSSGLQTWTELTPLALQGLHLADCRPWDLGSIQLIPYNTSPYIYLYYSFYFYGTLTNTLSLQKSIRMLVSLQPCQLSVFLNFWILANHPISIR